MLQYLPCLSDRGSSTTNNWSYKVQGPRRVMMGSRSAESQEVGEMWFKRNESRAGRPYRVSKWDGARARVGERSRQAPCHVTLEDHNKSTITVSHMDISYFILTIFGLGSHALEEIRDINVRQRMSSTRPSIYYCTRKSPYSDGLHHSQQSSSACNRFTGNIP